MNLGNWCANVELKMLISDCICAYRYLLTFLNKIRLKLYFNSSVMGDKL